MSVKGNKIIIKSSTKGGTEEIEVSANKQIYQLNLQAGLITLAEIIPFGGKRKNVYTLTEIHDGFHVYLPAMNKEDAKKLFNGVLGGKYK